MIGGIAAILISLASTQTADAKTLFKEGVALAERERWVEALERFEASLQLQPRASTLFNVGTTLMKLDRPKDAADAFRRFLEMETDPARRDAGRKLLAEAERAQPEAPPPPNVEPPPPSSAPPPPPPSRPPPPIEPAPEPRGILESPWFWVVAGVVVVGAGIGIGVGVANARSPYGGTTGEVIVP